MDALPCLLLALYHEGPLVGLYHHCAIHIGRTCARKVYSDRVGIAHRDWVLVGLLPAPSVMRTDGDWVERCAAADL